MRGHNPAKPFYIAVMIDNADGSLGEHFINFKNVSSIDHAIAEASYNSHAYEGQSVIYKCVPVGCEMGDEFKNKVMLATFEGAANDMEQLPDDSAEKS